MTAISTTDQHADSHFVIDALERYKDELPFAREHLALHYSCWQALHQCQGKSDAAVDAWRAALSRRWECEIVARRLYKQVFRQYLEQYGGADHLVIHSLATRRDTSVATPPELLADLRSLHADLGLNTGAANAARSEEILVTCANLDEAIRETATREAARRAAVLDRRVAQEAIQHAHTTTKHVLASCPTAPLELANLFV